MVQLAGFLGRRRRWVVFAWVVVLALALPIASHQTDHLTGGGFDVPGSESKAVSDSLKNDFGTKTGGIVVLLQAEPGAGRPPAPPRSVVCAARSPSSTKSPCRRLRRIALRLSLRRKGTAMLPLHSEQSSDQQIDSAATLREDLDPGTATAGVTTYLAGQPTIWAGMQELSKKDLAKAEARRLPDRRDHPARRLWLARRRGAAAGARLRQRDRHRGADLLHLAADGDLGLRHQHGLDDRDRGGDRLLAVHPRPLPRGACGGPRAEEAARAQALSTSGLAVAFSGLAVIVSLAGLWMVDNQAMRSMALGAMTVVAVSILAAMTLLPALIAMLGDRVLPGGIVA